MKTDLLEQAADAIAFQEDIRDTAADELQNVLKVNLLADIACT